jgi:hypothetical protein
MGDSKGAPEFRVRFEAPTISRMSLDIKTVTHLWGRKRPPEKGRYILPLCYFSSKSLRSAFCIE